MAVFRGADPFDRLPPVVRRLLIGNVIIFLIQLVFPGQLERFFAMQPEAVTGRFWIWQLATYAFLHGNFWHLFFNMFALWMFGPHVESYWGSRPFLKFYLFCVVGASVTQLIVSGVHSTGIVVGASGGIYGVLLAFGLLYPDAVIYLFFIFPFRALQAVLLIALLAMVSALSSGGSRVAHFAHLGGMLAGLMWIKFPAWAGGIRSWRSSWRLRHPKGRRGPLPPPRDDLSSQVDRILDKISSRGVDSLTEEEHEIMRRYSRRRG